MLNTLEWLAKYGFIDLVFGFGITGLAWNFLRRFVPSNHPHLHVDLSPGGPVAIGNQEIATSVNFDIRISGSNNFYIARAYFRPAIRPWWLLWAIARPTDLRVHRASDRITDKAAYELKFQGDRLTGFNEYEALVRPGHNHGVTTWLALAEPARECMFNERKCGVLYIEYASSGNQGIHRVRL